MTTLLADIAYLPILFSLSNRNSAKTSLKSEVDSKFLLGIRYENAPDLKISDPCV
jgi:hypothetical protein